MGRGRRCPCICRPASGMMVPSLNRFVTRCGCVDARANFWPTAATTRPTFATGCAVVASGLSFHVGNQPQVVAVGGEDGPHESSPLAMRGAMWWNASLARSKNIAAWPRAMRNTTPISSAWPCWPVSAVFCSITFQTQPSRVHFVKFIRCIHAQAGHYHGIIILIINRAQGR